MNQTTTVAAPILSAPVFSAPQSAQLLIELESQQDHLLRELDDLNLRIEQAIVVGQMSVRRPAESEPRL
ncbi:MAG TPA: hypothetical protein VMJ32_14285 [Pirellulales bacterium]|nr:hypothetical protein [Pirellulales bacterium]